MNHISLLCDIAVSHENTADVYAQETISADDRGKGIGDKRHRKQKNSPGMHNLKIHMIQ